MMLTIDLNSSAPQFPDSSSDEYLMHTYHLDMQTSFILIVADLIVLILNFYFHYLIHRMALRKDRKNSQLVIQNLLACYSVLVPITFLIVFIYLNILLPYAYPPSEIVGEWFCFAYEYFAHAAGIYLGAFSLFTAAIKCWFIVDNARAKGFGEEKIRAIFLVLHLMIPIIISALNSISNGTKDHIYVVNICWSQSETSNKIHNNSLSDVNESMDMLCSNRQYQTRYYLGESASYYIDPVLRIMCGSIHMFYLLFCSNMCELLLYGLVYRYLNR